MTQTNPSAPVPTPNHEPVPTKLNNYSNAVTLLMCGIVGLVGTLLPWVDIGLASRPLVAWSTDGVLVLVFFGAVLVLASVGTAQRAISASSALTCLICIVAAGGHAGFAVYQVTERARDMDIAMPSQIMGVGVYVVGVNIITGLAASVGALLVSPIPQLERATWIPAGVRLQKLNELRELRKISQGEYLYQTTRIGREGPQVAAPRTLRERLQEIDELRRDGVITEDEYASKRSAIIDDG